MKFLLINPPIYDFSAYDVWIKPLGLLYLSNILKSYGHEVVLLDYLDRNFFPEIQTKPNSTGKFPYQVIEKPEVLKEVPLKYKRYGISVETAEKFLSQHKDTDYVIISCTMTYWYPAVEEVVNTVRSVLRKSKIILGGIYPILMYEHAVANFADKVDVIFKTSNFVDLFNYLNFTDSKKYYDFKNFPLPDYTLYKKVWYVVVRFSYGCHYNCIYCASKKIHPYYSCKPIKSIIEEIQFLYTTTQCKNFVFYDDMLFSHNSDVAVKFLQGISDLNLQLKFFTPNGLNPKFITKQVAELMYKTGFVDPRLSLETINDKTHSIVDNKVKLKDFENAFCNLTSAGYKPNEISVYILAGLPTETIEDVYRSVETISNYKVRIRLCEMSIVPGSKLFDSLSLDEKVDPLLHNNTTFLFTGIPGKVSPWCSYNEFQQLKNYVKYVNQKNLS